MEHPIVLPLHIEIELIDEAPVAGRSRWLIQRAAQLGADQELDACCEWLKAKEWIHPEFSDELRAARRPKPPSLKQQALDALGPEPLPEHSGWVCYLFGSRPENNTISFSPPMGRVPNRFVRFMMRVCFDCLWVDESNPQD